jgi:NAD(P)-dependent dehydrogenase (short-subunit alcohol dehydrogenase family)
MTPPAGAETTAEEVAGDVDLSGKTVVITGCSAGLGVETARVLAQRGARIVSVVRDLPKGRRAADGIRAAVPDVEIEFVELDLFDLDSVHRGADEIAERFPSIDRLINNAGVMAYPTLTRTKEGLDLHLGTNHLGHFVLTARLVDNVLAAAPSRIINLSSSGHRISPLRFDDPFFQTGEYDKLVAYGQSKTANILFSVALEARFGGRGVHAVAVHPGLITTELGRYFAAEEIETLTEQMTGEVQMKSVEQGAATTVWAAVTPELDDRGGVFCEDCRVAEIIDDPTENEWGVMRYALDSEAAERLWTLSEQWSGQAFPSER